MADYVIAKGFSRSRQYFNNVIGDTIRYTSFASGAKKFWSQSQAEEKAKALETVTGNSHDVVEVDDDGNVID
jgi:hypothetical protein